MYLLGNLWSKNNTSETKWYKHQPEAIIESEICAVLWDFTVQTDHVITQGGLT